MSLSPTASSMLVILNNAKELIERSNDRQRAQDVIRALGVYAKSKNFKVPSEKLDNFCSVLIDSRPATLSFLIKDIVRDIIESDKSNQVKNKPKKKIEIS